MRNHTTCTILAAGLILTAVSFRAEARAFEDKFGRTIEAELVSHVGADSDSVKIRRDGKLFDTKLDLFSAKDRAFIREWMKTTPPTLDYAFRIAADKQQVSSSDRSTSYSRSKSQRWVYEITLTNMTRQAVNNLTVEWATWVQSSSGRLEHNYGTQKVEEPMRFNQELAIITDRLKIDSYRYRSYYSSYTNKDSLIGLLVRVRDPEGNIIEDWKSTGTKMTRVTWRPVDAELARAAERASRFSTLRTPRSRPTPRPAPGSPKNSPGS